MTSLYAIAIPPVVRGLKNTAAFLNKAISQAESENIDKQTYLSGRLHPTMADFPKQIYFLTSAAKAIPVRLNPSLNALEFPDSPEATFHKLVDRLQMTIDYLESIKKEDIDGRENEDVYIDIPGPGGVSRQLKFTPIGYLLDYVHPNFWFHVTTAYGILRKEGVELGKSDYLNGAQLTKIE